MMDNSPRGIMPFNGGFIHELVVRLKLVVRLMGDKRVSPFVKLLPILSAAYLVMPLDLMPIFPVDDAAVVSLGLYLFVELCPPDVVTEHLKDLKNVLPGKLDDVLESEDVVDGEFTEWKGE